eukprot:31445-Pelagococcus_subviridis.AAC.19
MKCDKEVKTAAVDAAKVVSKATELFLESLTEGAFLGMKAGKRKTVKYDDLEGFVMRKPRLEFLHDHVWAFKPAEKEPGSGAFCDRAGPRTTAFARCTPVPRFRSRHTAMLPLNSASDAFELNPDIRRFARNAPQGGRTRRTRRTGTRTAGRRRRPRGRGRRRRRPPPPTPPPPTATTATTRDASGFGGRVARGHDERDGTGRDDARAVGRHTYHSALARSLNKINYITRANRPPSRQPVVHPLQPPRAAVARHLLPIPRLLRVLVAPVPGREHLREERGLVHVPVLRVSKRVDEPPLDRVRHDVFQVAAVDGFVSDVRVERLHRMVARVRADVVGAGGGAAAVALRLRRSVTAIADVWRREERRRTGRGEREVSERSRGANDGRGVGAGDVGAARARARGRRRRRRSDARAPKSSHTLQHHRFPSIGRSPQTSHENRSSLFRTHGSYIASRARFPSRRAGGHAAPWNVPLARLRAPPTTSRSPRVLPERAVRAYRRVCGRQMRAAVCCRRGIRSDFFHAFWQHARTTRCERRVAGASRECDSCVKKWCVKKW